MSNGKSDRTKPEGGAAPRAADIEIGGLFRGLGNFVELLGDMVEAGQQSAGRSGEFTVKGLGEQAKGVYGVSVKVGIGGETELKPFGNIRSTKEGTEAADIREPLIDVFDEADEVVVVAELPGASDNSIQVEASGDVLSLASSGTRRYGKEIHLPCAVAADTLRRTYKNGLLEIRIGKA